jgi:hypothetical protein
MNRREKHLDTVLFFSEGLSGLQILDDLNFLGYNKLI